MIRAVHPGFYPSRIPDPRVKKAPDPQHWYAGDSILCLLCPCSTPHCADATEAMRKHRDGKRAALRPALRGRAGGEGPAKELQPLGPQVPQAVFRIRSLIRRIHMFLGLPDPYPDPLVRGMDPDLEHSVIQQK
jgi:hypothetical protein